jgi:hypothetical protein
MKILWELGECTIQEALESGKCHILKKVDRFIRAYDKILFLFNFLETSNRKDTKTAFSQADFARRASLSIENRMIQTLSLAVTGEEARQSNPEKKIPDDDQKTSNTCRKTSGNREQKKIAS